MTTQAIIRRDARALVAADPRLDPGGPMMIEALDGGFPGMIHLILGQQVSIEAADAMYARLRRLGPLTPEFLLALDDETLQSCGFTRMKTRYARTLADAVLGGLDLDGVAALDSTAAVTELVALPGIGRWTAECFLLFSAGHRDVSRRRSRIAHRVAGDRRPDDHTIGGRIARTRHRLVTPAERRRPPDLASVPADPGTKVRATGVVRSAWPPS